MANDPAGDSVGDDLAFDVDSVLDVLYLSLLRRMPDPSGRAAFRAALAAGHLTLPQVATEIANSAEAEHVTNLRLGPLAIKACYQGILDRPASEEDTANWTAEIAKGLPLGDALRIIELSEEAQIRQLVRITNARGIVAILRAERESRERPSAGH